MNMKTAEEWYRENNISGKCFAILTRSDIKQIQLDAFKAGMSEAAEIADKHYEGQNFNAMYIQAGYEINAVILTARDRKESL